MPVGLVEEELITNRHVRLAKGHNKVHICCVTFAQLHSFTLRDNLAVT